MPEANFIQIHSLHGYAAVLLNRDDSGLAKRISYGGKTRTRISSQCLKRHWRMTDGEHALSGIEGATAAIRSREIVTREIIDVLTNDGHDEAVVKAVGDTVQVAVYGEKGTERGSRQPLLLGQPEIAYLLREARNLADKFPDDPNKAAEAGKEWAKNAKANLKELRDSTKLPGGLVAALFGRMVTSDVEANLDAAIHVAHSFTIHEEESESDYFTVVDDLRRLEDDTGADHIGETELTSGIFYGYVVIDRKTLLENLNGDVEMAGQVVERLVHIIATVSPGAKLGSTAPYDFASWVLVEAGSRQPRSLAESFRCPCKPTFEQAEHAVSTQLERLDAAYGSHEARQAMSLSGKSLPDTRLVSLAELSQWAGRAMSEGNA